MPRRNYKQHCALAKALDVIGERWTLLLVRELLTGPKRYKELSANLPGMGTNLLADRLRDLRAAGLIDHEDPLYRLTPRGAELEASVLALARWGRSELGTPNPDDLWRSSWNVVALRYSFRPEAAKKVRGVIEYRIDGEPVQAKLESGTIETSAESPWNPDVTIKASGELLLGLSRGEVEIKSAEAAGDLTVTGDRRLFRASLRIFGPE